MAALRRLWEGWKAFGHYLGDFQARLLLTVFYFTVFCPYGLITRVFGDPLRVRPVDLRRLRSSWDTRRSEEVSLARARQTF
ncbi:MAG: hypothetical protein ACT4PY_16475 [Armatimonadota bacterium]